MRLGILASELQGERTGVGRFLEGLLTGLSRLDFDGEVQLFFQGEPFEHALWSDARFRCSFAGQADRSAVLWEQVSLPGRLADSRLDVFLGPAYSLPPRLPCPAIVALHDLSFEVLPEEFRWRERWRRRLLARSAARRASRVLTLSRQVARQIEERYGVASERIDVLPLAVDAAAFGAAPLFAAPWRAAHLRAASSAVAAEPGTAGEGGGAGPGAAAITRPYLLYLGSVLPRRRIDLLLEAFAGLARDHGDLRLVIGGANRLPRPQSLSEWIDRFGVRDRVVELGWAPERELAALLAGAELSFYLSTYEGFGLPPIESLAAGTPPVVSAGLGLDEVWPDYPLRCERLEASEIERVARRALDDAALRGEVADEGRQRVRALTWEECARRFLESARRAIGGEAAARPRGRNAS